MEDVLRALRHFGAVRVEVDATGVFACVLEVPGEVAQRFGGPTVLHAALACWADALESARQYTAGGIVALERFLARTDDVL